MITAAALCPGPPLLAREVTGADPVLPELRQACGDAAAALLEAGPDLVVVVGAAQQTRPWNDHLPLDLTPYAPGADPGGPQASPGAPSLPLSVGLGARLLDQAGYRGRRILQSVAEDEPAGQCAAIGTGLASAADRVALLVMADGSARRGRKAPGYLDERSVPFDAEVERAVRSGKAAALLALDPRVARELMVTGRASLQVLAGALAGRPYSAQIRYSDDPFGVAYLVASLTAAQ
ncbi:MAG: hypothetical protein ACLQFR_00560 [Streptosporangiaceae bacterium]